MPNTVLIADDHLVFLEGMKSLLHAEGYTVIAQASDGQEAVQLAKKHQPDIAVLDITMPKLNGLGAAQKIRKHAPETRVIVLTMHKASAYVMEALQSGVTGYVLKTQAAQDLIEAIKSVAVDKVYLSPGVSRVVVDACLTKNTPEEDPLTLREREVLQLIAEGRKTKEIAEELNVSVKTAESHRSRLMNKLDIHETAGLVRYAIRRGLIEP
jgi:DNA-binding NarL/FixJ family response regulator